MINTGKHIIVEYKDKTIIGLCERVVVLGNNDKREVVARVDTGATKSSIDVRLAAKLGLGPIIKAKVIQSALGNTVRPVVKATIEIANKKIESEFTLADREQLKYQVLIGQNILMNNGFLIDPSKKSH